MKAMTHTLTAAAAAALAVLAGCEPAAGPFALEVTPLRAVRPPRALQVVVATVTDRDGHPLANRRVEWIVAAGGVGEILAVDEGGRGAGRGRKLANTYAVSYTRSGPEVLDRGNEDASDDVKLRKGQTWIVLASPVEGATHLIVRAPGIEDWSKRTAFAETHWYDVKWALPPAATNRVGTPHRLVTRVARSSDGKPLEGYLVKYTLLAGPAGGFAPGGGKVAAVTTGKGGVAAATLSQARPVEGVNAVRIDIVRPADEKYGEAPVHLAAEVVKKTWLSPRIGIKTRAPARAIVGRTFRCDIVVSNLSRVSAEDVVLTATLPPGIACVTSTPKARVAGRKLSWSLGTLPARGSKAVALQAKAGRTGKLESRFRVEAPGGLSAEDSATTAFTQAKLVVEMAAPAEAPMGKPISCRVLVRNSGQAPAMGVKLVAKLPAGLTWKGATSVTAAIGTLAPGEATPVEFKVDAAKAGAYVITSVVTGVGGLSARATARAVVR